MKLFDLCWLRFFFFKQWQNDLNWKFLLHFFFWTVFYPLMKLFKKIYMSIWLNTTFPKMFLNTQFILIQVTLLKWKTNNNLFELSGTDVL